MRCCSNLPMVCSASRNSCLPSGVGSPMANHAQCGQMGREPRQTLPRDSVLARVLRPVTTSWAPQQRPFPLYDPPWGRGLQKNMPCLTLLSSFPGKRRRRLVQSRHTTMPVVAYVLQCCHEEDIAMRFGSVSPEVAARIDGVESEDHLDAIKSHLDTAATPDQLFT